MYCIYYTWKTIIERVRYLLEFNDDATVPSSILALNFAHHSTRHLSIHIRLIKAKNNHDPNMLLPSHPHLSHPLNSTSPYPSRYISPEGQHTCLFVLNRKVKRLYMYLDVYPKLFYLDRCLGYTSGNLESPVGFYPNRISEFSKGS